MFKILNGYEHIDYNIFSIEITESKITRGHNYASYMFVTRGLPTCTILIRETLYSFMMCIAKSGNTILQSILNSDALYASQMYQHWRSVLYINHF